MPAATVAGDAIAASPTALTAEEVAAGFVRPLRPLRTQVLHAFCQSTSAMQPHQAQDMARDPASWSSCWCLLCGRRLPAKEFTWFPTGEAVGS